MNKILAVLFVAAAGLLGLAGCGDGGDQASKSTGSGAAKAPESPQTALDPSAKPYPLKICLVSGEELGKMGEAYRLTYKGQEIKLCCKGCEKDFQKEPEKYLQKIAAAAGK